MESSKFHSDFVLVNDKIFLASGKDGAVFKLNDKYVVKVFDKEELYLRELVGYIIYDDCLPITTTTVKFESDFFIKSNYYIDDKSYYKTKIYNGIIRRYLPNDWNEHGNKIRYWFDCFIGNIKSTKGGRNYIIDTSIDGYGFKKWKANPKNFKEIDLEWYENKEYTGD